MRATTQYLAKLLGVFMILTAGWMMLSRYEALDRVHDIIQDRTLALTWGVLALGVGLAIVLGHNVWRGGLLPVVVTLVGWVVVVKGLALIVMSPAAWASCLARLNFEADYYLWLAIPLALGFYLTAAGFLSRPARGY